MVFVDPFKRAAVEAFLTREYFNLSGHQIKLFGRLGDKMAVTCYLVTRDADLFSHPKYADRVMKAVRIAFTAPTEIGCKADRLPVFSINLIERLKDLNEDTEVKESAAELLIELNSMYEVVKQEFGE